MFIAIDGIDGAGKTTLVRELAKVLAELEPIVTKEPTDDSKWGQRLREAALHGRLPRDQEVEYFHRDRIQHLDTIVRPALESEKIVITDRYVDSTLAYQCTSPEEADEMYQQFVPDIEIPDIAFIIDCPVSVGLNRIHGRDKSITKFENQKVLNRAKKIYDSRRGENYVHIDGTKPSTEVLNIALSEIQKKFKKNGKLKNYRIVDNQLLGPQYAT